jgi:hypothetical protein
MASSGLVLQDSSDHEGPLLVRRGLGGVDVGPDPVPRSRRLLRARASGRACACAPAPPCARAFGRAVPAPAAPLLIPVHRPPPGTAVGRRRCFVRRATLPPRCGPARRLSLGRRHRCDGSAAQWPWQHGSIRPRCQAAAASPQFLFYMCAVLQSRLRLPSEKRPSCVTASCRPTLQPGASAFLALQQV